MMEVGWKLGDWLEMARNGWEDQKWLGVAGRAGSGWNGWKWLEMDRDGWKWLELSKWLKMAPPTSFTILSRRKNVTYDM